MNRLHDGVWHDELDVKPMLLFFACFCASLWVAPVEPRDDLLRHLIAYRHGFDYRQMMAYAPRAPGYDPYLLFDVAAGALHRLAGERAFVLVQWGSLSVFCAGLFWLTRGAGNNLRFCVVLAALHFEMGRLLTGRPACFENGLMLVAWAALRDGRVRPWCHLALGGVMASFYHLFWIYLIPLALCRRIYALPLAAGLAGWLAYGGGEYLSATGLFLAAKGLRVLSVGEAAPLFPLGLPFVLPLLPLCRYWRQEKPTCLLVAWFLLPGQLRYLESAVPLGLSALRHARLAVPPVLVLALSLTVCFGLVRSRDVSYRNFAGMFPPGAVVFDLNAQAFYHLLYANPGIRVVPGFEFAWMPAELQRAMARATATGALDCEILRRYPVDYLVEYRLTRIPPCLKLERVTSMYRIWRPLPPYARAARP